MLACHRLSRTTLGFVAFSRTALLAVACFLTGACAWLYHNDDDVIKVTPEIVRVPPWVAGGEHAEYPSDRFIVVVLTGETAPGASALEMAMFTRLHADVFGKLRPKLEEPLVSACRDGRWVSRLHLPQDTPPAQRWTDGFQSAACMAVNRVSLERHNAALAEAALPSAVPPPESFENAVDDLMDRTNRYVTLVQKLAAHALAGRDAPPEVIAQTSQRAAAVLAFRDELLIRMEPAAEIRAALGDKLKMPVELKAVYRGKPAVGLPLAPHLSGLAARAVRQTDDTGIARVEWSEPIRYTGISQNLIGFSLSPDLLLPGMRTGLTFKPWTVRMTLPGTDNVRVQIELVEKSEGKTIANGPVDAELRKLLFLAGMPLQEGKPKAGENDVAFILTIEGVITCREIELRGTTSRQVRSSGALILRSRGGTALASAKLSGSADILNNDADGAARRALTDAWEVARHDVMTRFREAYPPIFTAPDESENKAR